MSGWLTKWGGGAGRLRRPYFNKKKFYMDRMYVPKKGGYSRTQKRLAKLEKRIKANELKTKDIASEGDTSVTGAIVYMSGTAQGDESVNREGLKINATRCYGRIALTADQSSAISQVVRIVFFIDKDCDGALPAVTDLLESADYLALFKHENRNRFRILYDKNFTLSVDESTGDVKIIKYTLSMPKKGKTIYYGGTSDAIANADANAIFMLVISKDDGTNHPYYNTKHRMRFYG